MARLGQSAADGATKIKKTEFSLPNLLSVEVAQQRRGSTGAAWPSARELPRNGGSTSVSDALLLVTETGRPRSSSYTAAAALGKQQVDTNHHVRNDSSAHDAETHRSGGFHAGDDVVDARSLSADPLRLKADVDQLKNKILSTKYRIQQEQSANEENVTWYLNQSEVSPSNRTKAAFEKQNQKSVNAISQMQKKLETYRRQLRDVEQRLSAAVAAAPTTSTASAAQQPASNHGHGRPGPKGLLRDVGSGLREIRNGVLGSLAVVPYDIRRGMKKMFGSADNLQHLAKTEPMEKNTGSHSVAGSGSGHGSTISPPASKLQLLQHAAVTGKESATTHSDVDDDDDDEKASSYEGLLEGAHSDADSLPLHRSAGSGTLLSRRRLQRCFGTGESLVLFKKTQEQLGWATLELERLKGWLAKLHDEMSPLQDWLHEERYRSVRLEEQLNDITDLYQTELANLKLELANTQEKLEYKMEERSRDLQEYIESCHTKISKMELQRQRQQQLLGTEDAEGDATTRALVTKFANVVLTLIAVLLLVASTAKKIVSPFVNSRWKLASVFGLVAALMLTSSYWNRLTELTGSQPQPHGDAGLNNG